MSQFPSIHADAPNGARVNISLYDPKGGETNVGGGASNCNQAQFTAYKQAKSAMARGDEKAAQSILRAAGFSC